MLKYLFVGIVVALIYRFWNSKPKMDRASAEPAEPAEEFVDYEELDQ